MQRPDKEKKEKEKGHKKGTLFRPVSLDALAIESSERPNAIIFGLDDKGNKEKDLREKKDLASVDVRTLAIWHSLTVSLLMISRLKSSGGARIISSKSMISLS